ncbi:MAG TPA: hypothetical protein VMY99_00775 [Nevskiaceae bacterium]|nr:hypothetical protein [Nevskiaceae bacterium]
MIAGGLITTALQLVATAQARCGSGSQCDTGLPKVSANTANLQVILQLVFGIIGVLAVILIVLAGLRFITADGDPQEIAKARQTIVYALVGLAIALSAEAIVTFAIRGIL